MSTEDSASEGRQGDGSRRRRRLDLRAVGICVCIAVIVATVAGLVASFATSSTKTAKAKTPGAVSLTPASRGMAAALGVKLERFDGTPIRLGQFGSRPMVVNFWQSTCTPCVREMPAIEQVYRSLGKRYTFLGVDVQEQVGPARRFIARTGVTYQMVRDPRADLFHDLGAVGLPTTLLIDSNGKIVGRHLGALTQSSLRQLIATTLH